MKIRKQNWPILFFLVVIIAISLFIWISIGRFNPVSVNKLEDGQGQNTGSASLYLTADENHGLDNWIPLLKSDEKLIPTAYASYGVWHPKVQDEVYKHFSLFDRPDLSASRKVLENDDLQLWQGDTSYGNGNDQFVLTLVHKNHDGNWSYTSPDYQLDQEDRTGNTLISLAEDEDTIYLIYAFLEDYDQAHHLKAFEMNKETGQITEGHVTDNANYELYSSSLDGLNRNPQRHLLPVDTSDDDSLASSSIYETIDPTTGESQQVDLSSLANSSDASVTTDRIPLVIGDQIYVVTSDYIEDANGSRPSQIRTYLYNSNEDKFQEIWPLDPEDNPDYYIENGYIFHTIVDGKTGYLEQIDIATGERTTIEEYTIEENAPYTFAKPKLARE